MTHVNGPELKLLWSSCISASGCGHQRSQTWLSKPKLDLNLLVSQFQKLELKFLSTFSSNMPTLSYFVIMEGEYVFCETVRLAYAPLLHETSNNFLF